MKIVLDTNCLLQILPLKSPYRIVWDKIRSGEIALIVSNEVINEYHEILEQQLNPEIALNVVKAILYNPHTILTQVYFSWRIVVNNPDDDKFVDVAFAANTHYLVSNGKHFEVVKQVAFPKIKIVSLAEFVEIIP
jgi:uncharacterized protein